MRTILAAMVFGTALAAPLMAAETIEVALGGAQQVQLRQAARQVVVGNPAIADITMQSPRSLTIFGKYPGGTSLAVMDGGGHVVLDLAVVVTPSSATGVTVRYGTGKSWVPGGTVAAAECSRERCSPALVLPSDSPYKTAQSQPAPAAGPAPEAAAK